jgi:putative FmdB family regulatory protein
LPNYEYECRKCRHHFEMHRAIFAKDEEIECPECGFQYPRRLYSAFNNAGTQGCSPENPVSS